MDILSILGLESKIKQAEKEPLDERYTRMEFDLGSAEWVGKDMEVLIDGDYFDKILYNGAAKACWFKFDRKRSAKIYPEEFRRRVTPFIKFHKIYLTNLEAQPGKSFAIFVGGAFAGEIEPSTGLSTGITSSEGINIDPCQDKRFKKHTFKHLKPTTMTVANTAQCLLANTKVKWAVVHFLTKDALIGDSTVTRGGGAADGQKYVEDAYLTLEYVSLGDVYIINHALGDSCIYTINYVEEE